MKATKTPLSEIQPSTSNPRTITEVNMELLINSILELPKMLELRPIITTREGVILGGNMRYKALTTIAEMGAEEINARIWTLRSSQTKERSEVEQLIGFWKKWQEKPNSCVVCADDLTEAEMRQLIIKDNVQFGGWDYDALENFDKDDLKEWGVTTWGDIVPLDTSDPEVSNNPSQGEPAYRERIIVIFPRGGRDQVTHLLGLPDNGKQAYRFEELTPPKK